MMTMMPLALVAKIKVDPQAILRNRWVHDLAHDFLGHLIRAERSLGLFGPVPRTN